MSVCVSPSIVSPLMIDDNLSCPQCPKMFTSTRLLQQHQQMFHTDKAFICETCGKAFRFRSNLAEHRSVHTALKPYVCKFCGKSSRLKGNLTKHILKHHKSEQNEAITKDDIIVKKKPQMESAAHGSSTSTGASTPTQQPLSTISTNLNNNSIKLEVDDYSFPNMPSTPSVSSAGGENNEPAILSKEAAAERERSIFISLGLDYTNSLDLRDTPETSVSPDNIMADEKDLCYDSPLLANLGDNQLAALVSHVGNSSPSDSNKNNGGTQCPECGKHVRKSSYLAVHMTLHHGFPPPDAALISDEKNSDELSADDSMQSDLRAIATAICELKAQQMTTPKIEQLLLTIDTRVSRLEKNMDMALNSIYTLVQLQTGMNSGMNRFKEDATGKLLDIKDLLEKSSPSGSE